jgi:hypothetical protein
VTVLPLRRGSSLVRFDGPTGSFRELYGALCGKQENGKRSTQARPQETADAVQDTTPQKLSEPELKCVPLLGTSSAGLPQKALLLQSSGTRLRAQVAAPVHLVTLPACRCQPSGGAFSRPACVVLDVRGRRRPGHGLWGMRVVRVVRFGVYAVCAQPSRQPSLS